jgi:response regulator RpfG family c-di-GMP phosphodiesterase
LKGVVKSMDLAGRSILLVEDEPLICLDITSRLQAAGAKVFAASHLDKALGLAGHPDISAGVLDFDLGNADSTLICWKLVDRRIPFIFHTGRVYSAFRQWPAAPVILKPSTHGLIASIAGLFR